jgi:hypothetical protein
MHPMSVHPISSTIHKGLKSTRRLHYSGSRRLNNTLSPTDRSSKQKTDKEILALNDTINQMDLTDVYRIFHQTNTYILLSSPWNFLQNRSYFGHKASLNKYKKI